VTKMNHLATVLPILAARKDTPSERLESDCLEFKEYGTENALHNAKDLAEEISALANRQGGMIIVGIRDSSNVPAGKWSDQLVGFPHIDLHTTRERLSGKLRPKLDLDLAEISFEGKNYLVIDIPHRLDTLVSTTSGKVCIRDGKSSRPMEPDEIQRAVKSLQDYDWSAETVDISPENALDAQAVSEAQADFANRRGSAQATTRDFQEAIGVTVNGRLSKAGLIFLGKASVIRSLLGNFEYRFSRKTHTGQLIVNDVWDDCLWNTIKRAESHFNHLNERTQLRFRGKEYAVQLLDPIAFHETYLNAIVHRDYSIDGMVSVKFLDDKLSVTSPGTSYGVVTVDNIFLHEPRHRNKALARMLMEYHLVDRAGMGVLRMSLSSLRYGRDFPEFRETSGSVTVSMQAQFICPGVFVASEQNEEVCGIPEYVVMNSVYEVGVVSVFDLIHRLRKVEDDPWRSIQEAIEKLNFVELCGDSNGVYVRVVPAYNPVFEVQKTYRGSQVSSKYVKLFSFLKTHKRASNADITTILGYGYTSQTSKFLRETKFVRRTGSGRAATWSLVER
jgi:ATP-dependent DNA helicase RecG